MAHDTGDKNDITYMRWDLLEPRARLLQAYADYAMGVLSAGWTWIEPEVAAQIEAERHRADEAEKRADEAEQRLGRLEAELADMREMLKAVLSMKSEA